MTSTEIFCVSCGSKNFTPHLSILLRCTSCGHITANLDLNSINSKELYSKDYFEHGEYFDYLKDRACFEKNFRNRLQAIRKHAPKGQLLEIGSASGFFLNLAKAHFTVQGYEICEDMANYAKKELSLDIRSADFLKDPIPANSYDAVVLWDCIEHLARPDQFFKKINQVLKPGGVVALTTGDISSMVAKVQGRKWRLIHPPTHVHYFTQDSIKTFLKNHGFEVLSVQYPGYYRSLRQIFYGLLINRQKKWWQSLDQSRLGAFSIYLNLYDIMQVTARKV